MASTKLLFQLLILSYLYIHALPAMCFNTQLPDIHILTSCKIDKIYQLGDSIADTGNLMMENPLDACSRLPYGESVSQGPTGRCSDGLLMIDHIDCIPASLENALFMVGEIGGNDYNYALAQGKTTEAQNMVPEVVEMIKGAVRKVIGLGATQVIVPGNFPIGCFPMSLTMFKSNNKSAYDEHQCLRELNNFAAFHNEYLQQAIITLQEENPAITIVYGDYYNAFKWLLYNAPHIGMNATSTLEGCCGNIGSSSFSAEGCGSSNVGVCLHPDQFISWDGVHLTQVAYSALSKWLVADIIPKLNCSLQVVDY